MQKGKSIVWVTVLVILLLYTVAWYSLISRAVNQPIEYQLKIENARELASQKLYSKSAEAYHEAFAINRNELDVRLEYAKMWLESGEDQTFITQCRNLIVEFDESSVPYEALCDYYIERGDFSSCFNVINQAKASDINSAKLQTVEKNIYYATVKGYGNYDEILDFNDASAVYRSEDLWGYIDSTGAVAVPIQYPKASSFNGYYAAVENEDTNYIINRSLEKQTIITTNFEEIGYVSGTVYAVKEDNKYAYKNFDNQQVIQKTFDYATTFSNQLAAVKQDDEWSIINTTGENTLGKTFADIKLDIVERAVKNERILVNNGSTYQLIDLEGNALTNFQMDDVDAIYGELFAFKQDELWGFANLAGEIVIKPQFEMAKSFGDEVAPVQIEGLWGYADKNGEVVIEPEYQDAKRFSSKGVAPVQIEDKWRLLRLIRFSN